MRSGWEKLLRALTAKSPQGRANYLIDVIAEHGLHDPLLDSLLHGINEAVLAEGPLDRKLRTWIKKTLRYR